MACDSGCCGPPKDPAAATRCPSPIPAGGDTDSCCDVNRSSVDNPVQDANRNNNEPSQAMMRISDCDEVIRDVCAENGSCCDANAKLQDDYCQPTEKTPSTGKDDSCCNTAEKTLRNDDCCSPKSTGTDCQKSCCSAATPLQMKHRDVSGCCEGKTSPCCDSTCIDRLALRECEDGKPAPPSYATTEIDTRSHASADCHRGKGGKPCRRHSRAAREQYQAKLEALGCICRALLALGQESCCDPQKRSSIKRKRSSNKLSRPRASADSCCGTGVSTCAFTAKPRPRWKNGCRTASPKAKCDACLGGCCNKSQAPSVTGSCADACCGEEKSHAVTEKIKEILPDAAQPIDLERGLSGKEHVILSISGMTCTGCETKLKRTLATLDSVRNLKTSLVLARAEFDLDIGAGSVAEVMKHLERTTEFKCERVTNQGSSLDLICPGDPADFVNRQWPDGVTELRVVDKRTIHVDFDAKIVGARELVKKGWGNPMQLAPPRPDPTLDAGSKHVRHVGYMAFLSIILTIPVLVMAWAPLPEKQIAYGSASLALATIVQFVVAGPFYPKALKSLIFSRMIEIDLLIVLSTSAAYIFSVMSFGYLVTGQPLSTGQFFETSTLLVTLIMVGRYVTALARQKAVESISIRSLQTSTAIIVDKAGSEKEIDARLLQYGDVFKVLPDSRIPTDGTVLSGSSELDESMITGESRPVEKYTGSAVIAGAINGSGTLNILLNQLPGDNTISTIAGMVNEAKLSKPKIQEIADRVSTYFVPVVISLTIITFAIWIAVGVAVRKQSGTKATVQAITYAITVLIVSCPCAIGLAVPMVIVIATGVAAERGVIFKSADSIEVAYKTAHVVFDKTGTLTQGKLTIAREEYFSNDLSSTKSLLLGLVSGIKHQVSSAVAAHLKANGVSASAVLDPKTLTGKGVEGTGSGHTLRAGNSRWLGLSSDPRVQSILSQGFTAFCFTVDGSLAAVFGLEDSLRPDALFTVSKLHDSGISVHVLSGDDDGAVRVVASQLSIPDTNVRSRCTPADKQTYIQHLLSTPASNSSTKKAKKPIVIFCGDGTNDAVALAQATIGVHMNEGTDVAKSAADVVLMRPSLVGILTAIAISKKSIHRIAFNFGWSFVYNLFAILLGCGAFVNARIPPEFAGLGELASVLPVIAAAVMLRWAKI